MRLLLVDDDAGFRELLRTTFEDVQVEVDEAGQRRRGREAHLRVASGRDRARRRHAGHGRSRVLPRAEVGRGHAGDPRRPAHRDGRRGGRGRRRGRGRAAVEAVPATRAARRRRAPRGGRRGGADAPQQRPLGRGAARPLRPRPASTSSRSSARSAGCSRAPTRRRCRHLRARSGRRTPARASTPSASNGTRSSSTRAIDPELAADPALEYGFLLHDIGKIGVPDQILLKPVELNEAEWRVMKAHTLLGAQMIGGVAFLHEAGVQVVRSHHERWDGAGYPDGLAARRSRSARGSSPSPTRSTRSRTTAPTAPPAAGATVAARSSRRRGRSSTRRSSRRSETASTCAARDPPRVPRRPPRTACVPVTQSLPAQQLCGLAGFVLQEH